jgi:hypothetical protein
VILSIGACCWGTGARRSPRRLTPSFALRDRRRNVYVALMWIALAAAGGYLAGHGLDATAYDCLRVIQISDDAVYDTWPDEWETHLRGNEG